MHGRETSASFSHLAGNTYYASGLCLAAMLPPNLSPFWAFSAVFTYAVIKSTDFTAGCLGLIPGSAIFWLCKLGRVI